MAVIYHELRYLSLSGVQLQGGQVLAPVLGRGVLDEGKCIKILGYRYKYLGVGVLAVGGGVTSEGVQLGL